MTADVRQQLTEALDEVERLARRAAEVCDCHLPAGEWAFDEEDDEGRILIVDDPHPTMPRKPLSRRWNGSYEGLQWAAHIARWDPNAALRLVERDRQLLADVAVVEEQQRENTQQLTEAWVPRNGDRTRLALLRPHASRIAGRLDALRSEIERAAAFWLGTPDGSDD